MKSSLPLRILNRVVRVEASEVTAMLWSFGYFFCLLCGYYILRPVRDEMGIQGGIENLQWLFTATFVAMIAMVPLFGWISARLPRRQMLPIVYLFFVVNLLVFFVLLQNDATVQYTARAFFVWVSVFNLFVVSVFWSFMADFYSNEQARRLFGFIAAGGSSGAIAGPSFTAALAPMIGPAMLLPISACLLLGAMFCIQRLSGRVPSHDPTKAPAAPVATDRPLGGSIFGGLTLLLKSDYLLGITLYVVLYTMLSTFLYFHQAYIVSASISDSGSRTALFASIDLAVNVLTLFGQVFVIGRLISRLGLTFALVVLPVISVVGFIVLGIFPVLAVIVALQIIRRAGEYAITRPAREVLFTVVTREEKYKAKNVIDTLIFRGGDAVSSWLFEGLRILGLGFTAISLVGVPIAALWATTGYLIGRRQEQLRAALSAIRRPLPHETAPTPGLEDGARGDTASGDVQAEPR